MVVVVALAWVDAATAAACTRIFSLELAEPGDHATDVPTNVVPWFRSTSSTVMVETGVPGPVDGGVPGIVLAIVDGEGAEVPTDAIVHSGALGSSAVELRPRAELRPFTDYWIVTHVHGAMEQYVFQTGAGPLEAAPPSLGELSMQVSSTTTPNSCEENTIACIPVPDRTTVHATVTIGDTVEAQTIFRGFGDFEHVRRENARFCIELRARNLAGQLGPPSRICAADVGSFDVMAVGVPSCLDGRATWGGVGYADEVASSGCGCSGTSGRDVAWPLLLSMLLVATRTRRMRRLRRPR